MRSKIKRCFLAALMALFLCFLAFVGWVVLHPPIGANARESSARRTAESLCSVYSAGLACGIKWEGDSVDALVRDLIKGRVITTGSLTGRRLRCDLGYEIDSDRWSHMQKYLHSNPATHQLEFVETVLEFREP